MGEIWKKRGYHSLSLLRFFSEYSDDDGDDDDTLLQMANKKRRASLTHHLLPSFILWLVPSVTPPTGRPASKQDGPHHPKELKKIFFYIFLLAFRFEFSTFSHWFDWARTDEFDFFFSNAQTGVFRRCKDESKTSIFLLSLGWKGDMPNSLLRMETTEIHP